VAQAGELGFGGLREVGQAPGEAPFVAAGDGGGVAVDEDGDAGAAGEQEAFGGEGGAGEEEGGGLAGAESAGGLGGAASAMRMGLVWVRWGAGTAGPAGPASLQLWSAGIIKVAIWPGGWMAAWMASAAARPRRAGVSRVSTQAETGRARASMSAVSGAS